MGNSDSIDSVKEKYYFLTSEYWMEKRATHPTRVLKEILEIIDVAARNGISHNLEENAYEVFAYQIGRFKIDESRPPFVMISSIFGFQLDFIRGMRGILLITKDELDKLLDVHQKLKEFIVSFRKKRSDYFTKESDNYLGKTLLILENFIDKISVYLKETEDNLRQIKECLDRNINSQ